MQSMTVYLGSDHVVKTPNFDFFQNYLLLFITYEDAKKQAQK